MHWRFIRRELICMSMSVTVCPCAQEWLVTCRFRRELHSNGRKGRQSRSCVIHSAQQQLCAGSATMSPHDTLRLGAARDGRHTVNNITTLTVMRGRTAQLSGLRRGRNQSARSASRHMQPGRATSNANVRTFSPAAGETLCLLDAGTTRQSSLAGGVQHRAPVSVEQLLRTGVITACRLRTFGPMHRSVDAHAALLHSPVVQKKAR
jgi:hypothetical protein